MPTYKYECDFCNNSFEAFGRMSDGPLTICPKCGNPIRQILSAGFGVNFVGNGFYVNDHKASKKSSPATSSPSSSSSSSSSSSNNTTGGCGKTCNEKP